MKTIRRRRWERKNPAPPPTPEGYVWATRWGKTTLVKIEEFQKVCQNEIEKVDRLPPEYRRRVHETGIIPDVQQIEQDTRDAPMLAKFGIARAR
jgi:hypothetical protein